MSAFQELADQQEAIGSSISKLYNAFKTSTERKTRSHCQSQQQQLEELWINFRERHQQMLEGSQGKQDHPYFTKQYYEQVQEVVNQFKTKLCGLQFPTAEGISSAGTSAQFTVPSNSGEASTSSNQLTQAPLTATNQTQGAPPTGAQHSAASNSEAHQPALRILNTTVLSFQRILQAIIDNWQTTYSRAYYEHNLKTVQQYWEEIARLYKEIISSPTHDRYDQTQYFQLEDRYHDTVIRLEERINSEMRVAAAPQCNVKLPEISLPTFDGTPTKWKQFSDLFRQLIHNQPLGAAQKLFYLKGNLVGEPSRLIRHLDSSEGNYEAAWNILVERYDNTRAIVTALLNDLFSQPIIVSDNSSSVKRLHDTSKECILALKNINADIVKSEVVILHVLLQKLDKESRRLYEETLEDPRELQGLDGIFQFLEARFRLLESIQAKSKEIKGKTSSMLATGTTTSCSMCKSNSHKIFCCRSFLALSVEDRTRMAKQLKLCINCLRPNHNYNQCQSSRCKYCNQRHNTLLHMQPKQTSSKGTKPKNERATSEAQISSKNSQSNSRPQDNLQTHNLPIQSKASTSNTSMNASSCTQVLLATAIIYVHNSQGALVPCRALLDSGSQLHFITERLCHELGLNRIKINTPITGIGGVSTIAKGKVIVRIKSRLNSYTSAIEAIILPKINDFQPQNYVNISDWTIPTGIELADPKFFSPQKIDMLIGAELYTELLQSGQIRMNANLPILQNSHLGWIVSGKVTEQTSERFFSNIATQPSLTNLDKQVKRFWELEQHDVPSKCLTEEERNCEDFFKKTFKRTPDGRFMVRLPFREPPSKLGASMDMAFKRFYSLERKLSRNPELKAQYIEFMNEYEALGHMEVIPLHTLPAIHYIIPHHAVLKPESSSTKLRVVFDASAKTTSGLSLNNLLMVGPTVQSDLFSILIKFRLHKYVLTTDVRKMYRQILVDKRDQYYQLILWRQDSTQPIQLYKLNTVTYGTSASPFLATRCLNQLAQEECKSFKEASQVLLEDTYVDDILTGAQSVAETERLKNQLIALLERGKFELGKFCSNHPAILADIPEGNREKMLKIDDSSVVKTLGLIWQPEEDVFQFMPSTEEQEEDITKRKILSDVSRLFDPLGLIAPVIVLCKSFIQELWKLEFSWDDPLPEKLQQKWKNYKKQLLDLRNLKIPRWVLSPGHKEVQLHAFADSSQVAYGGCCYIRTCDNFGQIQVRLLCSKSKLAPLKTVTIARLELCAALLMAELVERVLQFIPIKIDKVFYHTDSTTVLAWIAAPSYTWQTFVANRVAKIQELTQLSQWRHIDGAMNPADIISRGMLPNLLKQSKVWFEGPPFLSHSEGEWPKPKFESPSETPEMRINKSVLTATRTDILSDINHKNSWQILRNIIAYCIRFHRNCKLIKVCRTTGKLTISELDAAEEAILRIVQRNSFHTEYKLLEASRPIESSSHIQSLSPYFDNTSKLIRVGGRVKKANVDPNAKNQVLLPKDHVVCKLLLTYLHLKNLHAAPLTLLASARQKYWILDSKRLANSVVKTCIRCFRCKPQSIDQFMGDLPKERVQPSRPFHTTGIDFCGPVMVHYKLRGKTPTKTYIAVFICFATKAIHLELVSDLTSEAFLNALKRFISRRGLCNTIFCDNATNFAGANTFLKQVRTLFTSSDFQASLSKVCNENHITWKFIPPRSPHFGGLWEAAVKAAKYYLIRQVGNASLTYEELHTVLVQIEAILNSRPLTAMSSDPNDLGALTPGHFLIGGPLNSFPEPDVSSNNIDRLTRFQRLQHIQQNFWKRWSTEYIQQLQPRSKWKAVKPNIRPGMLVLLKDQNSPPLKWPLGRVVETHSGSDNLTRVVTVKTASGTFKRAIQNICPLPDTVNNQLSQTENKSTDTSESHSTESNVPSSSNSRRRKFLPIGPQWGTQSEADSTHPGPSTRKKSKISSLLAITLLTNLILPVFTELITLKPFNSYPGVYYENIGQLGIINEEWNLIIYYDMKHYWKEIDTLNKSIKHMTMICSYLDNFRDYCISTSKELLHELDVLNHNNFILKDDGVVRNKRSPFDIVGTIGNKLFGLLDAEYAKELEQTIDQVKANENHISELIREQTFVIDSTLNIIKKDEEHLNSQLETLTAYVDKTITDLKTLTSRINEQEFVEIFNSLAIHISITLGSYRQTQSALTDLILDTHRGKVNPLLLTPTQLQQQLVLIREHMPANSKIPIKKGKNEILQFYQILTVKGRITKESAVFEVKIPLVETENYELYQVIPLPIVFNNSFHILQLNSNYLSVSFHRDKFLSFNKQDIAQCSTPDKSIFLCKHPAHNGPMYNNECERKLFETQRTELPSDCKFITSVPQTWLRQLHSPNQWLYCVLNRTIISVVCGTEILQKEIEGEGLITFNAECSAKLEGIRINSHKVNANTIKASYIPAVRIASDHITIHNQQHGDWRINTTSIANHSSEINILRDTINTIRKKAGHLPKVNHHDIHQYLVGYLGLLLAIIVATWAGWNIRRKGQFKPTPAPRTSEGAPRFEIA